MLRRLIVALPLLVLGFPAWAQLPCASYPFNLTNGTIADANQVMSNFNLIRNCTNSLSPIGNPNTAVATNIAATLASPAASITITADQVQVSASLTGSTYRLANYNQTLNTSTTGAGGMDTGALPSSGTIGIYAIYNPVAPATSILGMTCSPCTEVYGGGNMPAGYTASALIAEWPTNGTPLLTAGLIQRPLGYANCFPVVTALTSGSGTYTTPSCGSVRALYLEIKMWGGGAGGVAEPTTNPPTAGGDTTFGTLTAAKGAISADNAVGGLGGTATNGDQNWTGGKGGGAQNGSAAVFLSGGSGGCPVIAGGGAGTSETGQSGSAGATNSGCGGAGGGSDTTNQISRPGGGGGGSLTKLITMPAATYSYGVGGGGNGGTSAAQNGGAGGSGYINVIARWW